ncbi:MAG: Rab family GTPase [Polyangiales bacterium]
MTQKHKVCLLGAAGVGKTSLVRRFVRAAFSEQYRTTVGVTIETKKVARPGHEVDLVIWDLSGEDEFQRVRTAYVRGASGYLLVVDGTRRATLETARALQARVVEVVGPVPWVLVMNKIDRIDSWDVDQHDVRSIGAKAGAVIETSAKTGAGVEEAFRALVDAILAERAHEQARGTGR